jgi:MOSC domain-containing protein YiiM
MVQPSTLHSINVSNGGVPKTPRDSVRITVGGCVDDRQSNLRIHGGPSRAVCIYSYDLIRALRAEGHPIGPGTIGENLTLAGVDWSDVCSATIIEVAGVRLEVTKSAAPCRNIADSFLGGEITRVSEKRYPGSSRWYCRVLREGIVSVGDHVTILSPVRGTVRCIEGATARQL